MIDANLLNYRLKCKNASHIDLENLLHISRTTYYRKVNENAFTGAEIEMIAQFLGLENAEDVMAVFFANLVA